LVQEHSLTSALKVELERLIFQGKIKAGERVNESTLAAHFRTSRGPLREALQALGEQGLISFARNRGAYVRQLPLEEAEELYDLRAALDDEVGRKLAGKLSEEQNRALEQVVEEMEANVKANDIASYYPNNLKFHNLLACTPATDVSPTSTGGSSGSSTSSAAGFMRAGPRSNAEHAFMLRAIQTGDAEGAAQAMRGHIEAARLRMRKAVKAAGASVERLRPRLAVVKGPEPQILAPVISRYAVTANC
jgi:DNA-binding GntR family transcriptional regulator